MTTNSKKVLNVIVTVIQILIVLLAITVSIIVLVNPNIENGEVASTKIKLLPVKTDSMKGSRPDSFEAGDLLIAKTPEDATALEIGDIIVFAFEIGGKAELNTHRIIEKGSYLGSDDQRIYWYKTKGDNNVNPETVPVYSTNVLAVVTKVIPNVGHAIAWLQQPNNFLVVIIVPLAVLFIYNIILFIRMIMASKLEKVKKDMEIQKSEAENIKQKAVQEYLQSLGYNPDNLPKAEAEEPKVVIKAEETKTEIKIEEPKAEIKVEEPKVEAKAVEEPKVVTFDEKLEPKAEEVKEEIKPVPAKRPAVATPKTTTPKTTTPKTTTAKTTAPKSTATKSAGTGAQSATAEKKAPVKKPQVPKEPKA